MVDFFWRPACIINRVTNKQLSELILFVLFRRTHFFIQCYFLHWNTINKREGWRSGGKNMYTCTTIAATATHIWIEKSGANKIRKVYFRIEIARYGRAISIPVPSKFARKRALYNVLIWCICCVCNINVFHAHNSLVWKPRFRSLPPTISLLQYTQSDREHIINLMWQAHNNLIDSYFVWLATRIPTIPNRMSRPHWTEFIFAEHMEKNCQRKYWKMKWQNGIKLIIQSIEAYLCTPSITQVAVWLVSSDKNVIMNKEWCHFALLDVYS